MEYQLYSSSHTKGYGCQGIIVSNSKTGSRQFRLKGIEGIWMAKSNSPFRHRTNTTTSSVLRATIIRHLCSTIVTWVLPVASAIFNFSLAHFKSTWVCLKIDYFDLETSYQLSWSNFSASSSYSLSLITERLINSNSWKVVTRECGFRNKRIKYSGFSSGAWILSQTDVPTSIQFDFTGVDCS